MAVNKVFDFGPVVCAINNIATIELLVRVGTQHSCFFLNTVPGTMGVCSLIFWSIQYFSRTIFLSLD